MKNSACWRPTKYLLSTSGAVRASRRGADIWAGSALIATLVGRWYQQQLGRHAHGRLLDLGCGKVPFYEMYKPVVDEVICTDWPNTQHGSSFIDFANDLNVGIPLGDAAVDTVIASDVLEHIYRPDVVMREIHRVLRPGGTAFINTPFIYVIHEAPYDFYRYTPFAIGRMAQDAGLDVARLDAIGCGILVLGDVVGKMLCRLPAVGTHAASALQRTLLSAFRGLPTTTLYPLFVAAVLKKPLLDRV